jgi:hypothetical protein
MNSSSAPETYSIPLNSDTIDLSSITTASTVTFDNSMFSGSYTIAAGGISTISPLDTVTITSLDNSNWAFNLPIEWVDSFPSYSEVEKMCKEYPALKIAFEKFKQTYVMVEDDWEAKKGNKYAT